MNGYYFRLILNLILNALTAIFSIFSFLMLVPFLQLIFKADAMKEYTYPIWNQKVSYQSYFTDWLTYFFTSIINNEGNITALGFICLMTLIVFLLKNLSRYPALYVLAPIKTGMASRIRAQLFKKITYLDSRYFLHNKKGELTTKLTHDIQEIEYGILFFLEVVLREPIMILITFVVMLLISIKLTLFVLIVLPFSGYLIGKIGKQLKKTSLKAQSIQGNIATSIDEMMSNNQAIKSNNIESSIIAKFNQINKIYYKLNTWMLRRRDLSSPLSEFLGMVVVLIVLFFGGSMILKQQSNLEAELFITYIVIFSQIIQPAKVFSNAFYFIQKGMASLERVEEVLNEKNEIEEQINGKLIVNFSESIIFKQVDFAYEQQLVLNQLSFEIPKGKRVALVGVSGSGKTTITKLLMRFYDVNKGKVLLDNIEIKDIELKALRNLIAWVPQQNFLFNDTIAYNIALSENVDVKKMQMALEMANLQDFISHQSNGIETIVGDNGIKLSGGEQQRIAIARAFYKDAPIVILDEATAHLDSQNENAIQNAIHKLMQDRTVLIIAHRLSTIQSCDKIIVLEKGKIIEQGSHQELMEKRATYYNLVQMQQMQ